MEKPTPQTGASKMAAAAKRGQAGLDKGKGVHVEEEDHPLSEKSLRARYVCLILNPLDNLRNWCWR